MRAVALWAVLVAGLGLTESARGDEKAAGHRKFSCVSRLNKSHCELFHQTARARANPFEKSDFLLYCVRSTAVEPKETWRNFLLPPFRLISMGIVSSQVEV